MIIQWLLCAGLLSILIYSFFQRKEAWFVSMLISVATLVGIYFVLDPEKANDLAYMLGVGRGADLVMYCWIFIGLIVSIILRLKILNMQRKLTTLVRELAIRAPSNPKTSQFKNE